MIRADSFTDTGKVMDINQDAIFCEFKKRFGLFCVADGMGGHNHGEFASSEIVNKLKQWYENYSDCSSNKDFLSLTISLEKSLLEANKEIYDKYNENGICGSTAVVLLILGQNYAVLSAGDSRAYLKHWFKYTQITSDDVWQNRAHISEKGKDQSVLNSKNYGKLTKAVGISDYIVFNRYTGNVKKGDVFFLCCDGVYKCVPEEYMIRNINKTERIREAVLKAGAPDNYSFIRVVI